MKERITNLEVHFMGQVVLGEREAGVHVQVEVGHGRDGGHESTVNLLLRVLLGLLDLVFLQTGHQKQLNPKQNNSAACPRRK